MVDPTVVVSPVDAVAPLASEKDTPANPNAGKALVRRLLFFEERFDMAQCSHQFGWQAGSVQPSVRPLGAVHMTAGHNALRGSGPDQ